MKDVMLSVHFIGIAMSLGTPLSFLFIDLLSSKMEKAESQKFKLHGFGLSKMGNIGIVLVFLSGGYLMTPHWSALSTMPLLMAKLVLFLVLAALIGIIGAKARKVGSGNIDAQLKLMTKLGHFALVTGLAIVVLAVAVFH